MIRPRSKPTDTNHLGPPAGPANTRTRSGLSPSSRTMFRTAGPAFNLKVALHNRRRLSSAGKISKRYTHAVSRYRWTARYSSRMAQKGPNTVLSPNRCDTDFQVLVFFVFLFFSIHRKASGLSKQALVWLLPAFWVCETSRPSRGVSGTPPCWSTRRQLLPQ